MRERGRRFILLRDALSLDAAGVAAALFLISAYVSFKTGRFLQPGNLSDVVRQASNYGTLAIAMVFVLAMGEVDLSVGAVMTLVVIAGAELVHRGWPLSAVFPAGLAIGAACGALNGILSVSLRVPVIIVTLATMNVYRGIAIVISKAASISDFPETAGPLFFRFGSEGVLGVPVGVLVMALVGVFGYLLFNHTAFGWRVQAIGSNLQAARFSGIPVQRYRIIVTAMMGGVAGLGGLVALAFFKSGDLDTGFGYEIFVIAAAIIGGTSVTGGSGSIVGAILGALLISVISNALSLLKVPLYYNTVITGTIILAAVAVSALIKRLDAGNKENT